MKARIRKLQVFRRSVQIGVIMLLLAIPAIARDSNYVASLDIDS